MSNPTNASLAAVKKAQRRPLTQDTLNKAYTQSSSATTGLTYYDLQPGGFVALSGDHAATQPHSPRRHRPRRPGQLEGRHRHQYQLAGRRCVGRQPRRRHCHLDPGLYGRFPWPGSGRLCDLRGRLRLGGLRRRQGPGGQRPAARSDDRRGKGDPGREYFLPAGRYAQSVPGRCFHRRLAAGQYRGLGAGCRSDPGRLSRLFGAGRHPWSGVAQQCRRLLGHLWRRHGQAVGFRCHLHRQRWQHGPQADRHRGSGEWCRRLCLVLGRCRLGSVGRHHHHQQPGYHRRRHRQPDGGQLWAPTTIPPTAWSSTAC